MSKAAPPMAALLALASENGRVCPRPPAWFRLYDLLPGKRQDSYGPIPAGPLSQEAWDRSSDLQKAERLREHLEWAQQHGALAQVHACLGALAEHEWHHAGG